MTNVAGQTDCHYCDVYQGRVVTGADRWPVRHCPKTGLAITMVITPHYPRLIDGGWENVYLAQVCPSVPHPLSCESPRW